MFHVKDNFKDGRPISQVGAGWFNKVASFLNNLVGANGISIIKNENGPSIIQLTPPDLVAVGQAQTAIGEYPTDEVTQSANEDPLWVAGGENGAAVMFAYKCAYEDDEHKTYAAKMIISRDGRILRIVKAENAGWAV